MSTVTLVKYEEFFIGWIFKINDTTAKPLTGYNVLIQIRPRKSSDAVLASYDANSPYVTFEPENVLVTLELPPTVTGAVDYKTAVIDCLVWTETDGDRSPTYQIEVDEGVSRPV